MCNRVGRLNCRNDSFRPGKVFKCVYRLLVRYRNIFRSSDIMQISMFRADARIIQSG